GILEADNFEAKVVSRPLGLQSWTLYQHLSLPVDARRDGALVLFCPMYVGPLFSYNKIVLTLQDISYEACPEVSRNLSLGDQIYLRRVSRWSAKKAAAVLVPSEFTKREVLKHYTINPHKICLTRLGVEERFTTCGDANTLTEIRRKYGIRGKMILFVGAIFSRRHIPELIKAFEALSRKIRGCELIIIGRNYTKPHVDIDGLMSRVNGARGTSVRRFEMVSDDELVAFYNVADLTIYLSDYEGFGLPVLESMACGTPVVTTRRGSLPEVAGDAAIYVSDPTDVNEISEAVHRGLTDKKSRQALIDKGLERVKKFKWGKCAEETISIIKQVARREL
ncbi:MAG: glycosyltransferase family 4 protein, partial [Actinobacteria bacterium]|nr:glycosyltransferase family 4 protein [Actinomycetota bacterium]